jgi:hypothetical protein
MLKGSMTTLEKPGSGIFGNLKAKQIKTASSNRGMTRRKGIPKRSMGSSFKK